MDINSVRFLIDNNVFFYKKTKKIIFSFINDILFLSNKEANYNKPVKKLNNHSFYAKKNCKKSLLKKQSYLGIITECFKQALKKLEKWGETLNKSIQQPIFSVGQSFHTFLVEPVFKSVKNFSEEVKSKSNLVNALLNEGKKYGGVEKMETTWSTPIGLLSVNLKDLEVSLSKRGWENEVIQKFIKDLPKMTVSEYIANIVIPYGTSCCGQTANILEDFIRPDGNCLNEPMKTANSSKKFIQLLNEAVKSNPLGNWFCRVNVGGHAFLIEYNKGEYQILQSFFGSSTLAQNIKKNRIFSVREFNEKMLIALSVQRDPTLVDGSTRALFGSADLEPAQDDLEYRFIPHSVTEEEMAKRINQFCQVHNEKWQGYGSQTMGMYITSLAKAPSELETLKYSKEGKSNSIALLIKENSITDAYGFPFNSFDDFLKNYCKNGNEFYFKRNDSTTYILSEIKDDYLVFTKSK